MDVVKCHALWHCFLQATYKQKQITFLKTSEKHEGGHLKM